MIAVQKSDETKFDQVNEVALVNDLLEKGLFVVTKEWNAYSTDFVITNVKVVVAWANRYEAELCFLERSINNDDDNWHRIYYPATQVIDLVPEDFQF